MPIVAYIIFGLIAITIIVMVIINFMYHNVKKLREAAEERYYRNLKRKEQTEKNPFGDDYFKSSKKSQSKHAHQQYTSQAGKNTTQTSGTANQDTNQTRQQQTTSQKEETTTRRTTTSDGVTIIDDRAEEKKIFDNADGEYVEFEEV